MLTTNSDLDEATRSLDLLLSASEYFGLGPRGCHHQAAGASDGDLAADGEADRGARGGDLPHGQRL